jgi:hypothetical protein
VNGEWKKKKKKKKTRASVNPLILDFIIIIFFFEKNPISLPIRLCGRDDGGSLRAPFGCALSIRLRPALFSWCAFGQLAAAVSHLM